ncbi:hypothetical protein OJ253_396 [Cryptosporidium canis]|uniref:Uncharacterized protein n=1 Tax=Cryptosporidium canis TaxID=195482 RepID=A0A9D5DIU3_9CRYT|nr:hypothetical protein OJ253_396 [Cryptosporidium canis]
MGRVCVLERGEESLENRRGIKSLPLLGWQCGVGRSPPESRHKAYQDRITGATPAGPPGYREAPRGTTGAESSLQLIVISGGGR